MSIYIYIQLLKYIHLFSPTLSCFWRRIVWNPFIQNYKQRSRTKGESSPRPCPCNQHLTNVQHWSMEQALGHWRLMMLWSSWLIFNKTTLPPPLPNPTYLPPLGKKIHDSKRLLLYLFQTINHFKQSTQLMTVNDCDYIHFKQSTISNNQHNWWQ